MQAPAAAMHIQLWSYNYAPEPLGIGPVSAAMARAMVDRGHTVEVVSAHPHYPQADWGTRVLPYRETRDGIPVRRLPLLAGRQSGSRRTLQELSFGVSQAIAAPFLGTPDALVAVTPSFPALLPALVNARARRIPLILWIQDVLPDGAVSTGYIAANSLRHRAAATLETAAYRASGHIVVLSDAVRENLSRKGVPGAKLTRAYNPATRPIQSLHLTGERGGGGPRVLYAGNIGRSQGLAALVRAFEEDLELADIGARMVLTGAGVAEQEVRAAIRTARVEMLGFVAEDRLTRELARASLAVVAQSYEGEEFNVPSKLMNYFAAGLPVIASVDPSGEAARLIETVGAGWITDSAKPGEFASQVHVALQDTGELRRRGSAGLAFAAKNLTPERLAQTFESRLRKVL